MNFEQRKKIASKVFDKLIIEYINERPIDIYLSNDTIFINGGAIYFNEILKYYNRLKEVKK
tara:strand:+ start:561 stop:743 length:183 start_codon:yes stop_codon:yes gene_type:complete